MSTTVPALRRIPQVLAHDVHKPRETKKWLDWVTTTDHKRIGIMYLVLTMAFFMLGGVEALLMRAQLSVPNNTLLSAEHYNQLLTMHGTTMVFLFVVPVMAGFGNYFVPLMIGARDMAFPRLNALSFWLLAVRRDRLLLRRSSTIRRRPAGGATRRSRARSILAQRRPGRLDLPDPPHRHLLARWARSTSTRRSSTCALRA